MDELDNIEDGKDLIKIAEKYKYDDPLLKWWAICVKWDVDGASKILEKFEEMWWKDVSNEDVINVITYESPDKKRTINMRDISSSEKNVEEAWYKVEATLDVIELWPNGKVKKWWIEEEIKFILLK